MEARQGKRMGLRPRIIMLPAPLTGHLNPMLQLAHILHSKGFSITIIHTQLNSPDPSMYPHFKFYPINDGLSAEEFAAAKDDFNGSIVLIMKLNQKCVEPLREGLARLLAEEEEEEEPVVCLIADVILPFAQPVADAFKLPRIVFRADSQLALPVLDQPQHKAKVRSMIIADNMEAFFTFIAKMKQEIKNASGMIWNSFKELEQPQQATVENYEFPPDLNFLIGPMHTRAPLSSTCDQDRACISWLDSQSPKSVVYVSFGSIAALTEPEFVEMAWGLANSKRPFLWVVRPGSVGESEWLEKLPKGFFEAVGESGHLIVKWAPQIEVLAHPATGCFWTHSGWNSVLESIYEGVPMICSPRFGDHFVAAKYIKDYWKIGVQLENGAERKEIEKEIKRIMVEKEGEEIRERAMFLKEKANGCIKEGGSSFMAMKRLVNHILSFK